MGIMQKQESKTVRRSGMRESMEHCKKAGKCGDCVMLLRDNLARKKWKHGVVPASIE